MNGIKLSSIVVALLSAKALSASAADAATTSTNDVTRLPTVTVTAEKVPESVDIAPLSVTPVTAQTIRDSGVRTPEEAAIYSPNIYFSDYAPRKNSSPRIRGIGGLPINPAVTTYYDGVPQLDSNSSNQELVDFDQVEFVRGAQSTLFGRNTIGGVINVNSARPSNIWTAGADAQYGNYNFYDARGHVSGPIIPDELSFGISGGYSEREGYSKSVRTGHDIDFRSGYFGKGQLLYTLSPLWEARLIVSGERDHDGDYPLGDLTFIRANPHKVSPPFEGHADRDIFSPTLQLHYNGPAIDFTSTSGGVWWKATDVTDLNYTGTGGAAFGVPANSNVPRLNQSEDFQFTQEFRAASQKDSPIKLAEKAELGWQSGLLFFTQNYQQRVAYDFAAPPWPAFFGGARDNHSDLDDIGIGAYGEGTVTFFEKLDLTAGVRVDYEVRDADYDLNTTPTGGATTKVVGSPSRDFVAASPHFGLAYRVLENQTAYGTVTRGYRAGGFNNAEAAFSAAALSSAAFDEEYSWNYEIGYKASFLEDRLKFRAAGFYIDWQNLQLTSLGPIANVFISSADAYSKGLEFEASARPIKWLELFSGAGYVDGRYRSASQDEAGVSIGGHKLQYTPGYSVNAGAQLTFVLSETITAYGRGEVVAYGGFPYDSSGAQWQTAYNVANFRAGVRSQNWFAEGWVRNAFDTDYVPQALKLGLATSGWVGETGAPMTFGLKVGANF